MDIYHDKQFILSKDNPSKVFNLKYSCTTLKINKIILTSHIGKKMEDWLEVVRNTSLRFLSIQSNTKQESSFVFTLISQLSANHSVPVFDVTIEVPQENIGNMKSLSPYYDKIEVKLNELSNVNNDLILTFIYMDRPDLSE